MKTDRLIDSIDALIALDDKGATVPRVPGLAKELLVEARTHLSQRVTGDIGGNPSYGPCPDCGGSGKVSAALVSPPDNGEAATSVDQRSAMAETVRQITSMLEWGDVPLSAGEVKLVEHIKGMPSRMTQDFSQAKIGRWLGWVQEMRAWLALIDAASNFDKFSGSHTGLVEAIDAFIDVKIEAAIEEALHNYSQRIEASIGVLP